MKVFESLILLVELVKYVTFTSLVNLADGVLFEFLLYFFYCAISFCRGEMEAVVHFQSIVCESVKG